MGGSVRADFDDYWSKSGEGWSHGPAGLPPPAHVDLRDCKTGPSEIQIACLEDMGLSEQVVSRPATVAGIPGSPRLSSGYRVCWRVRVFPGIFLPGMPKCKITRQVRLAGAHGAQSAGGPTVGHTSKCYTRSSHGRSGIALMLLLRLLRLRLLPGRA